jgi:hypothetical protein
MTEKYGLLSSPAADTEILSHPAPWLMERNALRLFEEGRLNVPMAVRIETRRAL